MFEYKIHVKNNKSTKVIVLLLLLIFRVCDKMKLEKTNILDN